MSLHPSIAVIGGGPAGLRAAEVASSAGAQVTLYEAKRSVGRKFLVAGKSGLNLTNGESFPAFLSHYQGTDLPDAFHTIIQGFNNQALRSWAEGLGVDTYVASSNKVFPVGMKAAPLLRRWITRLREAGVQFKVRHKLTHIQSGDSHLLSFDHDGEEVRAAHDIVVLALGGASWPQTGSDGKWTNMLEGLGIAVNPLSPANCGWEAEWPAALLEAAEGLPIKNIVLHAGDISHHGELVITRYGLEGGPIYRLGPPIRTMPEPQVSIDLKPTFSVEQLVLKMESVKRNFLKEAKHRWKLSKAAIALLEHLHGPFDDATTLARATKRCLIPLTQARPIEEAISSAGGVQWQCVDDKLMLRQHPGIFLAGEMLDWEAPTGGYLLQACFATGSCAGAMAASYR